MTSGNNAPSWILLRFSPALELDELDGPSSQWEPVPLPSAPPLNPTTPLQIFTWNIDFSTPNSDKRVRTGMDYLQSILPDSQPLPAIIILLQEITDEGLEEILGHSFIQQNFHVTERGRMSYFTTTLVTKCVPVAHVGRQPFGGKISLMGRDVLYIDIEVADGGVICVANTHLESLPDPRKRREKQLAIVADVLRGESVIAGIVGGDMNAIHEYDSEYPAFPEIRLNDVWELERQRVKIDDDDKERDEEGNTWGYQTDPNPFGHQRLDKFFYTGGFRFLPVDNIARHGVSGNGRILGMIGVGAKYEYDKTKDDRPEGNPGVPWITDHYGLAIKVVLADV